MPRIFFIGAALAAGLAPAAFPASPPPAPDAVPTVSATGETARAAPAATVEELVRDGNEARKAGRVRDAIVAYRRARDLSPGTYEIRILLADTLRRSGDADRALPEYDAARSIDAARAEGYTGRALILRARYDADGAAAILLEGLQRVAPASRADLRLVLAETRRRQGRLDESARLFEENLAARPGDAPTRAGLARIAEERGDIDATLRAWDRFLEAKPDDETALLRRQEWRELRASIDALRDASSRTASPRVLDELGRLLAVAGDAPAAAAVWRRALRMDADDADALRGLALAVRDAGPRGAEEAERAWRRVLKKHPRDGRSLYGLLGIARASDDPRREEEAWRSIVHARPDDLYALKGWIACLDRRGPDAVAAAADAEREPDPKTPIPAFLRRRVLLLSAAGRADETAEALDRLLLPDPTDPWSLEVANDVLFLDPGALKRVADRALKEDAPDAAGAPADPAARHVLLARLTWWSGRAEESLILLRRTVAAFPASAVARSALAEAYLEIGHRPDLAIAETSRAVALDPSRVAAHVDRALALLRVDRPGDAAAAAREGLARDPESAPALSVLGAALSDAGDFEGAIGAFTAALASDPADNFGLARGRLPVALAAVGRNVEARRALRGDMPAIPEMLYREAWAFARDVSVDRGFHGQAWASWRSRYRGALRTEDDAYRAIAVMLESLGDAYTRLRDPEETAAMFLSRRGAGAATDVLGRVAPSSGTVTTGDLPGGLGYIRLSNFTDPRVVAEVRAALEAMREKEGIVLDLRGNRGGMARAADAVGDLLVGPGKEAGVDATADGPVAQITGGEGAVTDAPLTVLVDGQTGSAAERLARALAGTGRATLAGDTTFGKGRAQMSRVLPGGATVLVSSSEMLGPDGRPLQGRDGSSPRRRPRLRRADRPRRRSDRLTNARKPRDRLLAR